MTGLTTGLTRLKQNELYTEIFFWGKCLGVERDYYVASACSGMVRGCAR